MAWLIDVYSMSLTRPANARFGPESDIVAAEVRDEHVRYRLGL